MVRRARRRWIEIDCALYLQRRPAHDDVVSIFDAEVARSARRWFYVSYRIGGGKRHYYDTAAQACRAAARATR